MLSEDDGIKYKSKNNKDRYDLIDGSKDTAIGIKPKKVGRKSKLNTPSQNYSTVDGMCATGKAL